MGEKIKMSLQDVGCGAWVGLIRLRTGTGGRLLWMWWWTFGLHTMQAVWPA